jgi:hypothetical protein
MEKIDNGYSTLLTLASLCSPTILNLVPWVWLFGLCLAIAALLLNSACNGSSSTGSTPPYTRPPTKTPTATATATPSNTPTPTCTPTPTYTSTLACTYDAELTEVYDPPSPWYVNSDNTFSLTLRNSGTCPWPEETKLVPISGTLPGWRESWSVGIVEMGEHKEISITLSAPGTPQTLLIGWQLEGAEGQPIGSIITHTLVIVGLPAMQTPAPTLSPTGAPGPTSRPKPTTASPTQPRPTVIPPPTTQPATAPPPTVIPIQETESTRLKEGF